MKIAESLRKSYFMHFQNDRIQNENLESIHILLQYVYVHKLN